MLGSFWNSRRDTSGGGDTTPKAPVHSNPDRERNPFEASLSGSSSSSSTHSRKNSATTTGINSSATNSNNNNNSSNSTVNNNNSSTSRAYAIPAVLAPSNLNASITSNLSSSTNSSNGSGGGGGGSSVGLHQHHGHHGLPAGLRTPTLQKSFVLPEVTSSVNATGLHVPNTSTSSKTATAALHQSPMYSQSSTSSSSAAAAAASNGRNTPTRTAHSSINTAPYPNPKEHQHQHPHSASPKSKTSQPDFKLSQPPDSKNSTSSSSISSSKTKDKEKNGITTSSTQSSAGASSTSASSAGTSTQANSSSTSNSNNSQVTTGTSNTSFNNSLAASTNSTTTTKKRGDHGSSSLKGKLTVTIIEARNLVTPEANIKPYVVATFEQNEFVSIEAINDEQDGENASSGAENTEANGSNGQLESAGKASAYNPVWKHEVAFDVTLDHSPVTFCVYARRGDEEFFLGLVDVKPELKHGWQVDDWYKLHPRQDEEVTGDVHVRMRFERSEQRRTLRSSDFEFLRMIGKGTFGRVFQVRKKDTKRIYAMKVLSKREIIAKKEVQHTIGERKILQRSSECPFLLGLKFSFQSETELFLVMDFKSGGELFHHLQKEGRFTEDRARFYAAEITLAFEYLHKYHIVYRDLKPENILLDATGHIVLCDFGLSKPDLPSNALTNTFCGTTEYLAPEVLLDDHGYSQTVDFWSLGVLLFEMCCGWSPFYAEDTQQMYKNICFGKIKFPRGVIGDDGKQFVKGLLNRNPAHRLGAKRDAAELKEHPFFKMIDWEALAARQVTVPFKPYVDSDECVRNFDAEFTDADMSREAPVDTGPYFDDDASSAWIDEPNYGGAGGGGVDPRKQGPMPIHPSKNRLDEEAQDAFRGFSYSGDAELNDLMMSASVRDNNDDDMRS